MTRARPVLLILSMLAAIAASGCNRYTVYVVYPEERANIFSERPETSIYVAEPADLRSPVEREGRGVIGTLHFPSDEKLDLPASTVMRRALMQDLLTTRVARLVHNPDNADYVLSSEVMSMTTTVDRGMTTFAVPLLVGTAIGVASAFDVDVWHGVKLGFVGVILGTFIPLPTDTTGQVEVRLELHDRATDEMVWSTTCFGEHGDTVYMSVSAREDKKLAERYLPRALKRANACAVGQLYQFLQEQEGVRTATTP